MLNPASAIGVLVLCHEGFRWFESAFLGGFPMYLYLVIVFAPLQIVLRRVTGYRLVRGAGGPAAGMNPLRIVVIGESWHGSSCTGLARGFRAGGHAVELIGLDTFFPTVDRSLAARALRRALAPFCRGAVQPPHAGGDLIGLRPDLVVVYKGTAVAPATLANFRRRGRLVCATSCPTSRSRATGRSTRASSGTSTTSSR